MDALDELNGKIEELCAIAEREREQLLDELIDRILERPGYNWLGPERAEIGQLALDYAEWIRIGHGFARLQRGEAMPPIGRVK